jgi:hypothetical protein
VIHTVLVLGILISEHDNIIMMRLMSVTHFRKTKTKLAGQIMFKTRILTIVTGDLLECRRTSEGVEVVR